ncbi:MAG TPA: hypothetical protein ENK43_10630 [Planctomycetes bacterium]|nr:hypothetical protein [Planctomycetota bacterium]
MSRGQKTLLLAVLLVVPLFTGGASLEPLRCAAALALSWPFRALRASQLSTAPPPSSSRSARVWEEYLAQTGEQEAIPVVARFPNGLVLGAGARDGVKPGDAVSAGGVFLGVIDRVTPGLSRMAAADQPQVRCPARTPGPGDGGPWRHVLLRGGGAGLDVAAAGSTFDSFSEGRPVLVAHWAPGVDDLLVGEVALDPGRSERVVRWAGRLHEVDRVHVHAGSRGEPVSDPGRPLFRALRTNVALAGDASPFQHSLLLPVGSEDGVRRGDWVSFRRHVIARVTTLGRHGCRAQSTDLAGVSLIRARSTSGGWRFSADAANGPDVGEPSSLVFTRGGSTRGPVPAGLLASGRSELVVESGARVVVHVFLLRVELEKILRGVRT